MSFTINMADNSGNGIGIRLGGISDNAGKQKKDSNVLFAGGMSQDNSAALNAQVKKEAARKQAMQLINKAWDKDKDIAKNMDKLEKLKQEKYEEVRYYNSMINKAEAQKKQYMEDYGIDPESEEQKDLELLEKYQNNKAGIFSGDFSEDEISRLKELQHMPRTEYQDKVLMLNAAKNEFDNAAFEAEQIYRIAIKQQSDAYINQPKQESMTKAKEAADAIMEAVNKDIIGDFLKEGLDNIEEELEEITEDAKEAREKKEEQQDKIEEARTERKENQERVEESREDREQEEELLDGIADSQKLDATVMSGTGSVSHVEEARQQVIHLMKRSSLLGEDLKGIEIDFKF